MEEKTASWSRASLVIDEEVEDEHNLLVGMIAKSLADEETSSKSDILCQGSVIFHPDQGVPKFSQFAKDVTEEAVVVFSRSHPDDNRALQIRSCSLRLHPPGDPGESLLDLQMYTGDGLWKDSATYKAFITAFSPSSSKRDQAKAVERWMLSSPINYSSACAAFVKNPSSAAGLVYNSTFPLALQAEDGRKYFVKFRIVPKDLENISGRLEEEEQKELWNKFSVDEEDQRERDYLKKELLERIASHSPTQMRLEMMSIEQEEENLDLLIPGTDWGRTWQDLGCITLCDVDMQEQSPDSKIRFRCDNLPAGLSIIESSGPADPTWWMATKAKVDEALSNLQEILQSGCTIEAQAQRSGHMWRNHGRRIFQELTKSTDIEMALRIFGDFSGWNRMPWTSDVHEPRKSIEHKVRLLAAATLQKEWDTQVLKSFSISRCYISLF